MMKKFPSSQRGFALVIALSLMAFVLLLILSISTLVQVESQSATAGLQEMRARLNAQLGAMIALGDLQRYTGPDQRVTARADILIEPNDGDIAGQSRWTGVWSGVDTGLTPEMLDRSGWLIGTAAPTPPSRDALAQPVRYWLVTRFMCSCSAACVTCRKCSIIGLMIEVRSASWMPSHFGKAPDVSRGVVDDILRQQR